MTTTARPDLHLVPGEGRPRPPEPAPDRPISYMPLWDPTPAPAREWAALAWVEKAGGGATGTMWHRRNDKLALSADGHRTRPVDELDAMVVAGTASVVKVTSVPALVREVLALRALACYPLGFHEEGDECETVDPDTGLCEHVGPYVARAADAMLRYVLCVALDQVDEHDERPRVTLQDLMTSLHLALKGELDPN